MNRLTGRAASLGLVLAIGIGIPATGQASWEMLRPRKAKNIIFMVPDGMGLSNVTAARIFRNGPDGDSLAFETLDSIGYQRTHSENATVTDSAAAAAAWACGEKFKNNEISCHAVDTVCTDNPKTILEIAQRRGKATGLVATSTITHATPAVWAAHVNHRNCETEIARQYIEETGVDVLLGGGIGPNSSNPAYNCAQYPGQSAEEVILSAEAMGYAIVADEAGLNEAVSSGQDRILGLFASGPKTPEMFRVDPAIAYPEQEPTLAEMTTAALRVLERDDDGFFLMVEGSQIDWANHANDIHYQIAEILAFDEAVRAVLDWARAQPGREKDTLLIVVPDHDCGGFAVNGPHDHLSQAGDVVEPGWTTNDHTAVDTLIWSRGPGSKKLGRALDNTDLFWVMKGVLR